MLVECWHSTQWEESIKRDKGGKKRGKGVFRKKEEEFVEKIGGLISGRGKNEGVSEELKESRLVKIECKPTVAQLKTEKFGKRREEMRWWGGFSNGSHMRRGKFLGGGKANSYY